MPRYRLVDLITRLQELEGRKQTVSDFELKLILEKCGKKWDMPKMVQGEKK